MQFTHTGDDGLTGLLIGMSTESRIFFCQFCKSFTHLALTGFGLRLDSQLDNGLRELHGLKDYRMLLITDGITGSGELETNCCCDVTGVNLFQLCTLVRMHLQDTSYTFLLVLSSIEYIRTGIQRTGIYTEVSELTYERVSHDLECKCSERLFIRGLSLYFITVKVNTLNSRHIQRRRHILNNSIQELLNALISVSSTATYRNGSALTGSFSQSSLHLFNGRNFTFQIHHCQIIIQLTNLFNELVMI